MSEDPTRVLTDTLPVQIWTATPDGALDFVSAQTARHFGVAPEALLRDGWQGVVHPEDLPGAGAKWMHSLASGEPYEVQFRLRMADGTYVWHLARAVAHRGEDGTILRWYGTNTNIAAEREQQRRMQALLDELTTTAGELETMVQGLRDELAAARSRIVELEGRPEGGR
ncbi:MAG: PAS domain-containing protein [Labilithrix sp.]